MSREIQSAIGEIEHATKMLDGAAHRLRSMTGGRENEASRRASAIARNAQQLARTLI